MRAIWGNRGLRCPGRLEACRYVSSRRRLAEPAWLNIIAKCSFCFRVCRLLVTRRWYVHSAVSAYHVTGTLWCPLAVPLGNRPHDATPLFGRPCQPVCNPRNVISRPGEHGELYMCTPVESANPNERRRLPKRDCKQIATLSHRHWTDDPTAALYQ